MPKEGGPTSLFIDFFLFRRRMERRAVMYGAAMTSLASAQAMEAEWPRLLGSMAPPSAASRSGYAGGEALAAEVTLRPRFNQCERV